MANKRSSIAGTAWSFLRLAMLSLWTRKNGAFKRRVKFLKRIGHYTKAPRHDEISYYNGRQLSFDETPIFRSAVASSMRFLLPCISVEEVDFDYNFGVDDECCEVHGYDNGRKGDSTVLSDQLAEAAAAEEEKGCEEGIDSKAEKFIVEFYEQMKLQRQISYLEYTEMLNRGAS
ncbi:CTP synthase family protein isoform 1 [Hibiscus syriacus]|uniref:CTP synthase family protein isoform 1 n=2 Tax=Hibiscus syriacus TaxID=106335 RepID=A0A6A2XVL0_HIBSY|nr:CTP synthase family protein isoform 1 [Hibiscus syriacus]